VERNPVKWRDGEPFFGQVIFCLHLQRPAIGLRGWSRQRYHLREFACGEQPPAALAVDQIPNLGRHVLIARRPYRRSKFRDPWQSLLFLTRFFKLAQTALDVAEAGEHLIQDLFAAERLSAVKVALQIGDYFVEF
jgi:hypothetical protein